MPRMIPSRPDSDCAASERKVFDRLAAALPAHWTVLHARTIVLPATAKAGATTCEIDFLVIDPARGLLALEVKGGGVQRESDDLWYSIDGSGDAHRIQNPQKQVTRNVYALRDWLRDQPIVAGLFLPIVWAIVLPDVKVASALGPELPRELIVDQYDLDDAAAAIDRIFSSHSHPQTELWWLAIEKLLATPPEEPRNSGTEGLPASLWVFHDPNQDIYGAGGLASLNMQQAELPVNCRNTARIARHAFAEVGEEPNLAAGAPDGAAVETIRCADEAAMKDAVRTALHRLVNEQKLDPSRITILTASAADKSIMKGATLANLKLVDWPAANKNEVGYCSLQRFKGLEADAVTVCEIDRSRSNATPKHLYVAQSRAKHVLVVAEYLA